MKSTWNYSGVSKKTKVVEPIAIIKLFDGKNCHSIKYSSLYVMIQSFDYSRKEKFKTFTECVKFVSNKWKNPKCKIL